MMNPSRAYSGVEVKVKGHSNSKYSLQWRLKVKGHSLNSNGKYSLQWRLKRSTVIH